MDVASTKMKGGEGTKEQMVENLGKFSRAIDGGFHVYCRLLELSLSCDYKRHQEIG